MVQKPVILFVHGAWHVLDHYRVFLDLLEGEGYRVVAPELASKADETPTDPTGADIELFANTARELADEGCEIVVVGHSYGGVIMTDAMSGLGLDFRKAQGLKGGVGRLIYVAGFMLEEGKCLEDSASIETLDWCHYEGDYKVINPGLDAGPFFYPDISPEEQRAALEKVVKHPKACSFHLAKNMAFREIATTFVLCEKDLAFPYPAQRATVDYFKGQGANIDVETLPSGHFPNMSMPGRLVDLVVKYSA